MPVDTERGLGKANQVTLAPLCQAAHGAPRPIAAALGIEKTWQVGTRWSVNLIQRLGGSAATSSVVAIGRG